MPVQNPQTLLAAAQARVGSARALLAHPRTCNLDECIALLREAERYLEWVRDSMVAARPGPGNLRAQAKALAVEIRHTGTLLEQAVCCGRRWLERLQSSAGYTCGGTCVPLQPRGRISIIG
jgi:hypothetical protein